MTEFETPQPVTAAPPTKEPAPGLDARAARPHAVRLRKSVVQMIVIGGAVLVSGSLAWAFVVQPELRDAARIRKAEDREDSARGSVRPTEAVTDQPASYDRLPEPRGADTKPTAATSEATAAPLRREAAYATSYRSAAPARPTGPSPRQLAAQSGLFFAQAGSAGTTPAGSGPAQERSTRTDPDLGAMYSGHSLVAPLSPFELKAGAIVPAALLTAVDTSRAGPVVATVTQNVYDSISGRHLLLPQGTRLIGTSEGESVYGDRRAFLTWERLILPNGKSLILSSEAGVDAQGATGVRGQIDRRLFPLLVGTLFAGAITTLGQVARDGKRGSGGLLGDAGDAAAIEGSQVGGRLVDRELDVRPSIRLRAGAPVRVMITRDLILEPYQP
ncbi:MAG: hypothetical protein KKG69_03775 [Alphaproteobacteria bacterium]|jgi:type IV secretion system protein VirB10|uniref:Type IV secretion system protein virB10 n=1 Tax=Brevundimonas mediterranea TaxID=74329 RepID=A0A7Z9C6P9_9CAUL|nr:TrbI/VirB10 family protein [Brevundimonas mediterranea]MBU2031167.1 hypothetical protein [Alphaproteobacteria bacterium]TAJ40638.1 MAG: hypothetical protein EPO54_11850 [Brevundimonas sp.]MBU2163928.1 hypothetical protein [Alphaproteobacteria bacterium]MBU2230374.1 hypothetical protein [Alphaproteobacteria bacterium]VDC50089.1 Type IV secretion system protein virB10 [Brevundimonas mediterranea]